MNAIINLGNPNKEMNPVVRVVLPNHYQKVLKIAGVRLFVGRDLLITSPVYGAGMILDCLEEMKIQDILRAGDSILLVGSMGSFCDEIQLGDIVLPNPCVCAYYGYESLELHQDVSFLTGLQAALNQNGRKTIVYRHGSSFAVFDPHTDHSTYKSALYDNSVRGVDCGEVFIGLEFATRSHMRAGAVLYCSDSPGTHVSDIGDEEFARRATDFDVVLNSVAGTVLRGDRARNSA